MAKQKEPSGAQPAAKQASALSTTLFLLGEVLFAGIAVLLLFVPSIQILHICYTVCGAALAIGVYLIVRYFLTDAFRDINHYGFSAGVLLVVLGICGMLRAEKIAGVFLPCAGIFLLFSGVVKLQYTLDLRRMRDPAWVALLAVTLILTGCSIAVMLQPFDDADFYYLFARIVMLADGVFGLLTLLYLSLRLHRYKKNGEKAAAAEKAAAEKAAAAQKAPQPAGQPAQQPNSAPAAQPAAENKAGSEPANAARP